MATEFGGPQFLRTDVPHPTREIELSGNETLQQGNGENVIILPGLLGTDAYLYPLHFQLRALGFRTHVSGIFNVGSPRVSLDRVLEKARRIREQSGKPVTLLTHSFGGILGVAAMREDQDAIGKVVACATPFNPRLLDLASSAGFIIRGPETDRIIQEATEPDPLPQDHRLYCIRSHRDEIVNWADSSHPCAQVTYGTNGFHLSMLQSPSVVAISTKLLRQDCNAA